MNSESCLNGTPNTLYLEFSIVLMDQKDKFHIISLTRRNIKIPFRGKKSEFNTEKQPTLKSENWMYGGKALQTSSKSTKKYNTCI